MSKILETAFKNKMNIVFTALSSEVDWGLEEQIQDSIDSLECASAVIDLGAVSFNDLTAKHVKQMDPDEDGDSLELLSMVDLLKTVNIVLFKNADQANPAMQTALFEIMHSRFFIDRDLKDLWSVVIIAESQMEIIEAFKTVKSEYKTIFIQGNILE